MTDPNRNSYPKAFNSLFRQSDLEDAAVRWNSIMGRNHVGAPCPIDRDLRQRFLAGSKALGCDPANTPNGDRFALSRWQGAVMLEITKLACQDATEFGEEIAAIAAAERIAAQNIGVDGVGVGAATVNHLRRALPSGMRLRVLLGGSEDSREGVERSDEITKDARSGFQLTANRFFNLRAQMAWELAQKLRRGTVALPKNAQLWRELLAIRYSTDNGEVKLEKKSEIAKRLGCSPDLADATIYGDFARDPLPMDAEEALGKDENQQDRAPRRMLDSSGKPPKRVKAEDELERIFQTQAKINARRALFSDPWRGR